MISLRGTVVDGYGRTVGGGLDIDDDGILTEIVPLEDAAPGITITPGFVDVHCHGGGGGSFTDNPTPEGVATAIATHRRKGTTGLVASLVSLIDPLPVIEVLVDFCERGELVGIHLEGPFVSKEKCGAQNPANIRDPELDKLEEWLKAGKGWIKTMTIAPELPGSAGEGSAAHLLLKYGAVPSWGHTSSDGEATRFALEDTAAYAKKIGFEGIPQTATHLFNAMPTLTHRAPGPVRELLRSAAEGDCVVEVIGDGVHVNGDLVADILEIMDANGGAMLITDALQGAGLPDGDYNMGGLDVEIRGGVAHLAGSDTIAGSTAQLSTEGAFLVGSGRVPLERFVRAAVSAPARALRLENAPGVTVEFAVGQPVNAAVFDKDFKVLEVLHRGQVVPL